MNIEQTILELEKLEEELSIEVEKYRAIGKKLDSLQTEIKNEPLDNLSNKETQQALEN